MTTTDPASAPPAEAAGVPAGPDGDSASTGDGSRVPGGALLVLLAVLTLLLAVTAVVLAVQLRGYDREDQARRDALQAARQFAINLTAVDIEDYEGDVAKVRAGATGDFLAEFETRTADGELKSLLEENESRSSGEVVEAGVLRADRSNATVLIAIDVVVRNTAAPEGRQDPLRMQLELEERDGTWLTSVLEFVS